MNIFKQIGRSSFLKNMSVLMTGTVIAAVIPALVQPILTRVYAPEDFGLFGLYFSFIGIFTGVVTLRYDLAVPLPEKKEDNDRVAILSLMVAVVVAILFFIFAFLFRYSIADWMNNEKISTWVLLAPFSIFFGGMYQTFNYWLVRQKAFKASAINRISQKVTDAPVMVLLGYMKISSGQMVGDFFGRMVMAIFAFGQAMKRGFSFRNFDRPRIKELARKYRDFPLYNALPSLADTFALYLPVIFISSFYGDTEAGFYTNTRNLLSIPLIFISRNLSQVLLERFVSKKINKQPVFAEVMKIMGYLTVAIIPVVIILVLFAPRLFAFVFGEVWYESGQYTQILVLSYALRFLVGALSVIFAALEKIQIASYWQVFFFIAIVSLALLKGVALDAKQFLWALMIVETVSYSIYLWLMVRVSRQYDRDLQQS